MKKTIYWIQIFFLGSILGWCWEVIWIYASKGLLVNRGVLRGPWLPIYGTGCVIMMLLKKVTGKKPLLFFISSMAVCGVIEYLTSWALESVYHMRWWDYSNAFMNLNGRICLICLLFFGVGGSVVVYILIPKMEKIIGSLSGYTISFMTLFILIVLVIDISVAVLHPNTGIGISGTSAHRKESAYEEIDSKYPFGLSGLPKEYTGNIGKR